MDLAGPWLAPLQPALGRAWAAWQAGATVADALHAVLPAGGNAIGLAAGPLRFVPQSALPAGEAYEAFIHRSACVPTRDNPHDFFNGLVWLAQPAIKRRLNALQITEIARHGVGSQRGPVRDALTLFDENGALLHAPPPLWRALRQRDWPALFITHRALWADARLVIVGHALLEKLATAPRKALTAHVLPADAVLADAVLADAVLAMDATAWAAKPFCPLPVLGVPGWWPANAEAGFYEDAAVFRPGRRAKDG
ncbi:MAG: DUF3025 domain-containing protein [Aquabacterium sp.]|nr:DUF3025 domain-containing protein [Aquabacterium sp.]